MREFNQAVSLGRDCQPAAQSRRHFGKQNCPSCVFDHQVTPHPALIAYLENDCRGFFERDDLEIAPQGWVQNKRYKTQHMHEFPNGIEQDYERARSRHDHICENLRKIIYGRVPTLFVCRSKTPELADTVSAIIRSKNPRLRFHVLVVVDRPDLPPTKPFPDDWRGNDDYYSSAFSEFRIIPRRLTVGEVVGQQATRFLGHLRTGKF